MWRNMCLMVYYLFTRIRGRVVSTTRRTKIHLTPTVQRKKTENMSTNTFNLPIAKISTVLNKCLFIFFWFWYDNSSSVFIDYVSLLMGHPSGQFENLHRWRQPLLTAKLSLLHGYYIRMIMTWLCYMTS